MRRFLVLTEKGRIKRRISFYIAEITEKGLKLIDNDFTVSMTSNRGVSNEAVNCLVNKKVLEPKHLDSGGYINLKTKDFELITIESNGLAYINFL